MTTTATITMHRGSGRLEAILKGTENNGVILNEPGYQAARKTIRVLAEARKDKFISAYKTELQTHDFDLCLIAGQPIGSKVRELIEGVLGKGYKVEWWFPFDVEDEF